MAELTLISRKPLSFVLFSMAVLGAFFGLIFGISLDSCLLYTSDAADDW